MLQEKIVFSYLGPGYMRHYNMARATCALIIGFKEGKILTIHNKRGVDILGGHRNAGEALAATARREIWEEGKARLSSMVPCGLIRTNYKIPPGISSAASYMVVYAARVKSIVPRKPDREVFSKPSFLSKFAFLCAYGGKQPEGMRKLISAAEAVSRRPKQPQTKASAIRGVYHPKNGVGQPMPRP